jgi:hypothetical protein
MMKAFGEGLIALGIAHFDFFRELLLLLPRNNGAVMTRIDCPRSSHTGGASICFPP